MIRREHLDERDVGISSAASSALSTLFDEPQRVFVRHFVLSKTTRSACGIDGIHPNTNIGTTCEDAATCGDCRARIAERQAKEDKRALQSLAKGPKLRIKLHGPRRVRLERAGLVEVRGALVLITQAGRAALKGARE